MAHADQPWSDKEIWDRFFDAMPGTGGHSSIAATKTISQSEMAKRSPQSSLKRGSVGGKQRLLI